MSSEWKWWAGTNEEWMQIGPCDTREQAIAEAQYDASGEFTDDEDGRWKVGFHVVEARQDPLRLADWIGLPNLLERADESLVDSDRVSCEYDDGPWFEATPAQEADLIERIRQACDDWQTAHGLTFKTQTFSDSRNAEYVVVPHPDGDAE